MASHSRCCCCPDSQRGCNQLFKVRSSTKVPSTCPLNPLRSIIISNMGFTQFQTTLLDIPGSIIQILSLGSTIQKTFSSFSSIEPLTVGSGYLAGKFKNSRAILMVCCTDVFVLRISSMCFSLSETRRVSLRPPA